MFTKNDFAGLFILKRNTMGRKVKQGKAPGNKKNIKKNTKRIMENVRILKSLEVK